MSTKKGRLTPPLCTYTQLLATTLVMLVGVLAGKVVCPIAGGVKLAMALTRASTFEAVSDLPSPAVSFSTF